MGGGKDGGGLSFGRTRLTVTTAILEACRRLVWEREGHRNYLRSSAPIGEHKGEAKQEENTRIGVDKEDLQQEGRGKGG